jgi:hypothetical protein
VEAVGTWSGFFTELPQEGQKAGELFKLAPQELQKFGSLDIYK